MELKSQQGKIDLKVNPSQVQPESTAPLQPVLNSSSNDADSLTKTQVQPYNMSVSNVFFQNLCDISLLSGFGGILTFAIAFLLAVCVSHPVSAMDFTLILDSSLCVGFIATGIWFACSTLPIWFGLSMLFFQAMSGALVGEVVVSSICILLMIDPSTLGPMRGVWSFLLSCMFSVVPIFALPVYSALMNSSPQRKTLGAMFFDYYASDLKGNKLSFRQAWKRSVLSAFAPFLYPLSVALGKKYRDRKAWLDQTSSSMLIKTPKKLEEEISKSKETVMVRYRAFQELETTFGNDSESVPKVMRRVDEPFRRASFGLLALLSVNVMVGMPVALMAPTAIARRMLLTGDVSDSTNAAFTFHALDSALNSCLNFFMFIFAFMVLYLLLAACRPTHIEISRKGIRFIFKTMPFYMQDAICPWDSIQQLTLEQIPGKASIADHRLVFNLKNGKKMRLRLGSISFLAGKEEILRAVERWAPGLPRSTEVISALQPPCDFSYTELWMEALIAPPKREKLKPLIDGAVLRTDQYTVVSMLGVGGQGTAYLADDALSGQTVVLKEFLLPVYVDVSARRRALETFEKEARLLKELSHPNVVKLVDYFIEDHRAYLVLEHIDGKSLRNLVNQDGQLSEEEVRKLAKQMCEILNYLHSQSPPVVHRDFTPDNLILRKDGTLKLIDFNVAQQSDDSSALSSVVGKPNYLSPEQFRGSPVPQSDIYALGACLQFLLTGEDPVAILSSNPSATRDDVSEQLSNIVQKATEPELLNRFSKASEISLLLEE